MIAEPTSPTANGTPEQIERALERVELRHTKTSYYTDVLVLKRLGGDESDHCRRVIRGHVLNMSASGVLVEVRGPIAVGLQVRIHANELLTGTVFVRHPRAAITAIHNRTRICHSRAKPLLRLSGFTGSGSDLKTTGSADDGAQLVVGPIINF